MGVKNTGSAGTTSDVTPRFINGIGDSITANGGGVCPDARNHIAQSVMAAGGKLVYTGPQFATFGYTTAQILSTWLLPAIANTPISGLLVVLGGTNDVSGLIPAQTTATNLFTMWATILAAGRIPVAATIPPNNGFTNAQRVQLRALNLWITEKAQRLGIPLADYFSVLVDPTTGSYKTNYTSDGTHPSGLGGAAMGPVLAAAVSSILPGSCPPIVSDGSHTIATGNLNDDPLLLRTTISGGVPVGAWQENAAASPVNAYSIVTAQTPGLGNVLRITTAATATGSQIQPDIGTQAVSTGDRLIFAFRIGWTPGNYNVLNFPVVDTTSNVYVGGFQTWDAALPENSIWVQEFTIPSGTTAVQPKIILTEEGSPTTAAILDVGQFTIQDMTATIPTLV